MRGDYARVELVGPAADFIAAAMGVLSTQPFKGPGLTQEDAVQLVSRWAWMRDRFMRGAAGNVRVALAEKGGAFRGTWDGSLDALGKLLTADTRLSATLIVGDGPLVAPAPGGPGLPNDWAIRLGRALDGLTLTIAQSEQAGDIPAGFASITKTIGPAAITAIIVGGAALAVVGGVAVWRYFDPELRKHTSAIHAAAQAYDQRLQTLKATGQMPPPSQIELGAQSAVESASKDETRRSLVWAGAIAGGLTVGAVGIAAVRSL